jgi:hypothetical protein
MACLCNRTGAWVPTRSKLDQMEQKCDQLNKASAGVVAGLGGVETSRMATTMIGMVTLRRRSRKFLGLGSTVLYLLCHG